MNLFTELKRRNVFRVGAAYAVASWLIIEVSSVVLPVFGAPEWVLKLLMVFITVGLVIALMLSWLFEITPEGLMLEADVDRSESITSDTAKKLDRITIALVVIGLVVLGIDRMIPEQTVPIVERESAVQIESDLPDAAAEQNQIERSVAVLPFADMSPGGDQEFFADGITEEILNTLVRVPQLKVAARTSSFQFKGTQRDITDIGAQLGVATVLEGSVRQSGDRVRITAQLINVADGFHLWSQSYDEAIADLFKLQNRIARQIAGALSVQLDSLDSAALGGTSNPAAFAALVRGRHAFAERHLPGKRREGIEQFSLATQIDPSYTEAWALYAYSMSISGSGVINLDPVQMENRMRAALDRGLELAPDHPPDTGLKRHRASQRL